MAAFKRGTKVYVEPTVPGIGKLPRLSTGQSNVSLGNDMEAMLRVLANTGMVELVEQVRDKQVKLPELWHAYQKGRAALEQLRDRRKDPLLEVVAKERKDAIADERIQDGYDQLIKYAPAAELNVAREFERAAVKEIRLSWLLDPRHVTALYELACETRKPNTVRRTLHRAVSDLLTRRFSRGRMLSVIADAETPGENDERDVGLTLEEIARWIELADAEFRPVIGLMVTTGIDRTPLLEARVRHYDEALGTLQVIDTKTSARPRTLLLRGEPVLENAEYWLRQLVAGKNPEDKLISLSVHSLRDRFEALRVKLGRKELRMKDVRAIFATYYLLASGGQVRELQHILGHSNMAMTMRYAKRLPAGNKDKLREAAKRCGLPTGGMLKIERQA